MVRTDLAAPEQAAEGVDHLLTHCGALREGEKVLVVCDFSTLQIGDLMVDQALRMTPMVHRIVIPPLSMHGQEPPPEVSEGMAGADLCLGVTAKSMVHTEARRRASSWGCRYLSLPDYSMELLCDPSLRVDYRKQAPLVRSVAEAFTEAQTAQVETQAGTSIALNLRGRKGNACPGFVSGPGELGSPPDIEANVSPVETDSNGRIVVDGSIPYPTLGLVKSPVTLHVQKGHIVHMEGDEETVDRLRSLFSNGPLEKVYVLAECGVGLNPLATLTGRMLTDEGSLGTVHFGFGSNSTVGGFNEVPFHLDMVLRSATLKVGDRWILREGRLQV